MLGWATGLVCILILKGKIRIESNEKQQGKAMRYVSKLGQWNKE